jgi:two-component system phosphate regulon sensor histidine kinase PhoR
MTSRLDLLLALAAGLLAAIAAVTAPPPLAAFVGTAFVVLVGLVLLRRRVAAAADDAAAPLAPARPPAPKADFGRALIERLPAALIVVSRTGRIAYANRAAETALPRVRQAAHFASAIRAPAFVDAVHATLADGAEREIRFAAHLGRERFFEARVALLPSGGAFGPDASAIVQIDDRTETRRAEQMRSDFIANASHELRTPLAAVLGYIETLQNHARDDPEARERFLAIMAREAGRMRRLVDDLMSLSRIEMTEHRRPVEEMSLNAVAADSAAALLPMAQEQEVRLRIDVSTEGAPVLGDRDQLAQVFTNLIENAMKYGGAGATVRVHPAPDSRANPGRWGVTVADDGPGIPREHVHRLTERFYRVSPASSRNKGGTGLGLAIVKHILNRHEGRLEIASAVGAGSAFTVWLPRAPSAVEAGSPAAFTKAS